MDVSVIKQPELVLLMMDITDNDVLQDLTF